MGNTQQQAVAKAQPATSTQQAQQPPKWEAGEYATFAANGPPHDFSRIALHAPPPMQPELAVNQPGDAYEQEAEHTADAVMQEQPVTTTATAPAVSLMQREWGTATVSGGLRATEPWLILAHELCGHAWRDVHTDDHHEPEEGPEEDRAPLLGRDSAGALEIQEYNGDTRAEHGIAARGYRLRDRIDERIPEQPAGGVIQRECSCGGKCPECKAKHAQDIPHAVVENMHSAGQPLDAATRADFEPRFGHDFSRVRIHNDTKAHTAAQSVAASAYTIGADISFAAGQFQPRTPSGRHLLAHELTHVVQQQHAPAVPQAARLRLNETADAAEHEAAHIADAIDQRQALPSITAQPVRSLARAPFDLDNISKDANEKAGEVIRIGPSPRFPITLTFASLFFKYGFRKPMGDITMAADYPAGFTVPTDKTRAAPTKPKPDTGKVTLSNIPVNAHFFPSPMPAKGKALIIGGFHGDERPGFQATDALVDDLNNNLLGLAFNTIVIPRLNAAAIKDELDGVKLWRNRCNRQLVDLNRDFPTGGTAKDTDCGNTGKAPRQPETEALIKLIEKFKPDRIVSVHAISKAASAGIFADPNTSKEAIELARGMASTLVNPSDRKANELGKGPNDFNAVYPLDRGKTGATSAGTSLGAWAPTAGAGTAGKPVPTITIEAPGFKDLDASGAGDEARTVKGFVRPLKAFLTDPDKLATAADRDILSDIDAFNAADKVAFLTGLKPAAKNDLLKRIKFRVDTAIAHLNALKPPVTVKAVSDIRLFSDDSGSKTAQAKIYFDKFFLTGDKSNGWDTLPDNFFNGGNRRKGVDRAKWLATPSKDRLDIILRFSALPGTSRHHWGTEIDFNSVQVDEWAPASAGKKEGPLFRLGEWLKTNAPTVGLIQSYTAGRSGGYSEEPWHYSYAPIAKGLRERYNDKVNLQSDVIDKIVADFTERARTTKQTMPADFAAALGKINISDLVNNIGPGL
jgi:hypothetical protein